MKQFSTILFLMLCFSPIFAQWESTVDNTIPQSHRVWSIKMAPDLSIWVVSTFDAFPPANQVPKVHRSANGGETWVNSEIPTAISVQGWDISPIDSMNAFVALDTAGLYRTADGGQSWQKDTSYIFRAFYVHFFNQNEGWVVGADTTAERRLVMSLTSDGGQTWTNTGNGIGQPEGTSVPFGTEDFFPFTFSLNSSYDVYGSTIILGRSAGNYWRSDDKGYNWTNHETPLKILDIMTSNVAMKDEDTFMVAGDVLVSDFSGTPTVNFTTKDGGETWLEGHSGMTAAASHYLPNTDSIFIMVGHANFGWGSDGTAISYNYGETWEIIDNTSLIAIDFVDENNGVGACCNNSWSTANGQISIWNFELPTATTEVVYSNQIQLSPNPVANEMTIKIGEQLAGDQIHLAIISANGQVIKKMQASNKKQITLEVNDLPKGLYILKILGETKAFSKKFIKN